MKSSTPHNQQAMDQNAREKSSIKLMGDLFNLLGPDPIDNIHIIVRHANKVIRSKCALYNRLDDSNTSLHCRSGHNLPDDFPNCDTPDGHICYEAAIKGGQHTVVIEDISKTPFQQSDPLVDRYGLKSYLGHPVRCRDQVIGALAVVDTRIRKFSEVDQYLIATLAKALSIEEERQVVQKALSKSESKYKELYDMFRLLADNVPDLIWAKDLENRYLFANQAMCDQVLKCKHPDQAMGKTDLYFAQQERQAGHEHTYDKLCVESDNVVRAKMTPRRFLHEGMVRNQRKILDIHKAPFWGPDGEMIGTVGCGRDVTKERRTEYALQESERRYRDLYQNTPVMLCSIDSEGLLTSVSNLWLETLGYTRKEVLGHSIFDFFTPESRRDAIEVSFPEFYQSGLIKNRPFTFLTRNGEQLHIHFSAIAEKDTQGNYCGALAFAVDITQTKRAQEDKYRLSARLQQAQKMEAIATLAGGVAHQFNNALAVIMGNLELIRMDEVQDEKLNHFLNPINQAGQKMVQLTGQLLAYARGGKFQTQTMAAHLFVKNTLSLLQHSVASNVDLETDLDETTDHIQVDPTQMQMLMAAILSNAAEAIEGKGRIRISLMNTFVNEADCQRYQGLKKGSQVLLRIADNGKGMDEQTRGRIFEPFFTTKFQGRGLGMAAVYGIVKKHGGYVFVDSQLGKGTEVSIYLPGAAPSVEIAEAPPTYQAEINGTALVVEDEHLVMEVNRALVAKMGYQVIEARSGNEAIRIAKTHEGKIDFTLLDVILPDMDGSRIYPELMAARPDMKVIVCSGFALDGPARQILDSGAESFIQKPFTVAALSAILDKIFKAPKVSLGAGQ